MSDTSSSEDEEGKRLFIICPIGDLNSEARKRSDQVKKYIIDPIAEEMGYTTIRADGISQPGTITNQIVERLLNDELVVADLTGHNPNVFYELAVRHAKGEPVILMISHGQKIPFDVSAQRIIFYDHMNLDSVDDAKRELRSQITAVESKEFIVDSPIKTRIPLENLQRSISDDTEMHEVLAILRNHSEQLENITAHLNTMRTPIIRSRSMEIENLINETEMLRERLSYEMDRRRVLEVELGHTRQTLLEFENGEKRTEE